MWCFLRVIFQLTNIDWKTKCLRLSFSLDKKNICKIIEQNVVETSRKSKLKRKMSSNNNQTERNCLIREFSETKY